MANYLGFDPAETTPYYFISYDTSDKERVSEYVTAMNAKGLPMWYDHGIHAGTEWESVIADHIVNCEAVILFFSKRIFLKEDSYVRKEFNLAVAYGKRIIVVLLDDIAQYEVPIKYALWWESVRDLQGVLAFTCANIDECVDKVLDGLNSKNTRTKTTARVSKPTTRKIASPEDKYAKKILKVLKAVPRKFTKSELIEESKLDLVEKEWRIILEKMKVDGDIAVKGDFIWATLYDEEEIDAYVDSAKQMVISFMENEIREYSADELIAAMPETIGLPYGTKVFSDLVDTKRIVKSNGYYFLSSIDVKAYHMDIFKNAIYGANGWVSSRELCLLGSLDYQTQLQILSEMAKKGTIVSKSFSYQCCYCSPDFALKEKAEDYAKLVESVDSCEKLEEWQNAKKAFQEFGDYKQCAKYVSLCDEKIKEINRTAAREAAYEEYLKKYPLMKRKEELEKYYPYYKKQYKAELLGWILGGAFAVVLAILGVWLITIDWIFLGVILCGPAAAICYGFREDGASNLKFDKKQINEYNELKKIPPFEWKDES